MITLVVNRKSKILEASRKEVIQFTYVDNKEELKHYKRRCPFIHAQSCWGRAGKQLSACVSG